MRQKVLLLFTAQQICFFGGLFAAILIRPEGLAANGGISYYGIFANTIPFYITCLLGTATFSFLAARTVTAPKLHPLRRGLLAFSALIAIIALMPYSVSIVFDLSHTVAGIILFLVQISLSIWLLVRLQWAILPLLCVITEVLAGIVSALYVLPAHGFLIQSQIVFQAAFALLLLYGFKRLLPPK